MRQQRRDEAPARRVARTSGILGAARILELSAGLVVSVLVAAKLGVTGLGAYATGWAVFTLLAIMGQAGLREYVSRELSRAPERTGAYLVHLGVMSAGAALALAGLAVLVISFLPYPSSTQLSASLAALMVVPKVVNVIQEAAFLTHNRAELELLPRAGGFVAYVAATAVLLAEGYGVPAVFGALLAIECVIAVVYFLLLGRYVATLEMGFDRSFARQLVTETRPYAASAVLAALFTRPEVLILSIVASQAEVGLYGAAVRIADSALVLIDVFLASVFPLLAREHGRDEERFAILQATSTRAVLAYALPVAALLIAAGGDVLAFVFGAEFRAAAEALQILALSVVVVALYGVLWRLLVARGRQDLNVRIQAVTVPVRIGAALTLAIPFGASGAASAVVVGSAIHCVLLRRAAARIGAPPRLDLAAARLLLAACAGGVVTWLVIPVAATGVAIGAGCVTYVVAAFATGAVSHSDRAMLLRAVRRGDARPPGEQPASGA